MDLDVSRLDFPCKTLNMSLLGRRFDQDMVGRQIGSDQA